MSRLDEIELRLEKLERGAAPEPVRLPSYWGSRTIDGATVEYAGWPLLLFRVIWNGWGHTVPAEHVGGGWFDAMRVPESAWREAVQNAKKFIGDRKPNPRGLED